MTARTKYLKAYSSSICDEYGAKIKFKADSTFMKFIASFLNFFGIMDKEDFEEYSTTIGRTIYLSFKVGDFTDVSYYKQIEIIAHEITHVAQYNQEGLKFFIKYLFSRKWRVIYEMYSYGVSMEIFYYLTKTIMDPQKLADKLIRYRCTVEDIQCVAKFFTSVSSFLGERTIFKISKSAMYWLTNHSDILWETND